MAGEQLAGGQLMNNKDKKTKKSVNVLKEIAGEMNVDGIDKIIYAWLLKHPVNMLPIIGTSKIDRLKNATTALDINMSLEQ